MDLPTAPLSLRNLLWRAGRKLYMYARREGRNNPVVNGEYWLIDRVLATTAAPHLLLDVGANKGDWSVQAAERSRTAKIWAFEPSQATRAILTQRVASFGNVAVHPYAVSDAVGEASFYSNKDGGGTNSMSPVSGDQREWVAVTTIDQLVKDHALAHISMLKIDTEGFDSLVLKGASQTLSAGIIDVVQFEYNWRWLINRASLRDVFELINGTPYRLGKLAKDGIELHREWHFELDRYFEDNYVLIREGNPLLAECVEVYFDGSNAIARRT